MASVEESQVAALEKLGYRRESTDEVRTRVGDEQTEAYYDTAGQKAIAFAEGAAGGVTLGLAELALDDQASREREQYLPGWKLGGEITGTIATALATGGSGLTGQAARATPAGAAMIFGEKVAAKVGGGAITRGAVSAGVEGGISGGTLTGAKVLTDSNPDTIESFVGEVGLGTLFGLGSGAALGGVFAGAGQLGKGAKARIEKRLLAGQAADETNGLAESIPDLRASFGPELAEAKKGFQREADLLQVELDLGRQKLDQMEELFTDGINYTDEIEKVLARKAAGELTEEQANKLVARLGNAMVDEGAAPSPHSIAFPGGDLNKTAGAKAAVMSPGAPAAAPSPPGPPAKVRWGQGDLDKMTGEARDEAIIHGKYAKTIVPTPSTRVAIRATQEPNLPDVNSELKRILGRDVSAEEVAAVFEPGPGYSVLFDGVEPYRDGVDFEGVVTSGKGDAIAGHIERILKLGDDGVPEMHHHSLELDDAFQGKGIGRDIVSNSFDKYTKLGIGRVKIPLAVNVGRYYWQKLGYKVAQEDMPLLLDKLRVWIGRDAALAGKADELLESARLALDEPGGLTNMRVGNRNIGREFLLSSDAPHYGLHLDLKRGDKWYEAVRKNMGLRPSGEDAKILTKGSQLAAPSPQSARQGTLTKTGQGKGLQQPGLRPRPNPNQPALPPGAASKITPGLEPSVPRKPAGTMKEWDEMSALEAELVAKGNKAGQIFFKLKKIDKLQEGLTSPEALSKLKADELISAIEDLKDALKGSGAYAALSRGWAEAVEKAGGNLAGVTPVDMAKLANIPEAFVANLDAADVPILAAWERLGHAPKVKLPAGPVKPGPVPGQGGIVGRGIGRAFRHLGGKLVSKAIPGGGLAPFILGWAGADAAWSKLVPNFMRGAKKAAAARIDNSLAHLSGLTGKLPAAAVGPIASHLTASEFAEASREVHDLAGAGGRESLYMATSNLRLIDPKLADGIVDDGVRRAQYLAQITPEPPSQGLFRSARWTPSDVDRAKLGGAFQAVLDPPYAVEMLAAGRLTPSVAKAFRETSPALYARVAQSLLDFSTQNPDAPPAVRRQVALMLDAPADELTLYTAELQAAFAPKQDQKTGPAMTAKPVQNLPTQAQTLTER